MSLRAFLLGLLITVSTLPAMAGLMEISYSFSLSDSTLNADNYTKTLSHTASMAWYFMEMSALEVSYSKGEQQISGKADGDANALRYRTEFVMYGADLILTFANRESVFQPYIKGGAVWIDKKLYRRQSPLLAEQLINESDSSTPVPSLGAGFKFFLLKNLSLKASYDTWRSNKTGGDETWDSTIRAGVSVYF